MIGQLCERLNQGIREEVAFFHTTPRQLGIAIDELGLGDANAEINSATGPQRARPDPAAPIAW